MRRALLALALLAPACAGKTPPAEAPPEDPRVEWNAALAAVHRRGLTPSEADPASGRIVTMWAGEGGRRERLVIVVDAGKAQVTRELDPPGPSAPDPAMAAEIEANIAARRAPP